MMRLRFGVVNYCRYMAAVEALGASRADLWEMAYDSIEHIFACDAIKLSLKLEMQAGKKALLAAL